MALPVDLDLVTVRGRYVRLDGVPISGKVTFTAPAVLTSARYLTTVIPSVQTATLDENGAFSIDLPATDDPDISPTGWTYTVTEAFPPGRTYPISVPISEKATGVELATIAPAPSPSSGTSAFVTLTAFSSLSARVATLEGTAPTTPTTPTTPAAPTVPELTVPPTTTLAWTGVGTPDVQGRTAVDPAVWTHDLGGGETPIGSGNRWGNWQEEVSTADLSNVCCKNGQLVITARRESTPSPVAGEVTGNFSSGRIHTGPPIGGGSSKFLVPVNAYHEARIWMPETPGAWPAFWGMGANWVKQPNHDANWPYCGEIDTVECFGQNPYSAGFALHMPETGTQNDTLAWQHNKFVGWGNEETSRDPLYDGLTEPIGKPHTYGVWRSATEIRRYIDRREVFRYTKAQADASGRYWPFNQGFFILINLAVGGQAGSSASIGGMGARMVVDPIKLWTNVTDPAAIGLT